MTWEQGRNRLLQYCHGTIDAKGWIELKDPNQRFKSTRLLEDYEKTIHLPLPEKLIMASVTIDKTGVSVILQLPDSRNGLIGMVCHIFDNINSYKVSQAFL